MQNIDPAGPAPTMATREPVFNLSSSFLATDDLSFGGDGGGDLGISKMSRIFDKSWHSTGQGFSEQPVAGLITFPLILMPNILSNMVNQFLKVYDLDMGFELVHQVLHVLEAGLLQVHVNDAVSLFTLNIRDLLIQVGCQV